NPNEFNLDKFSLKIKINDKVQIINLVRTNGILANRFLPIWITSNESYEELNKLDIMEEVGNFTMYHDYSTKTAIVYFHKWNRIDGVININYYIRGLPFNKTKKVHSVNSKYIRSRSNKVESYANIGLYQSNDEGMKFQANSNTSGPNLYPELLVATSYDLHMAIDPRFWAPDNLARILGKNSHWSLGVKTVFHIITEYNAVDMIFQTVKSAKIKLNIAGIVIEGTKNRWGFEKRRKLGTYNLNAEVINLQISNYVQCRENYFPQHSYDVIIYNTNKRFIDSSGHKLNGKASTYDYYYSFPPYVPFHRSNIAVKSSITYQFYTTIVRKLTYLITAADDMDGPTSYLINIAACKQVFASSQVNSSQTSCLEWSKHAEEGFKSSLKKPVHCDCVNYPRSLSQPVPKKIFSAHEQCRCYGHVSHVEPDDNISEDACNRSMYCRIEDPTKVATAPMPIDGTPCGRNKVCWNSKCLSLGET
ncbi:hypothetical protein PV325_010278, partial [Microctonus aethiopoides]